MDIRKVSLFSDTNTHTSVHAHTHTHTLFLVFATFYL